MKAAEYAAGTVVHVVFRLDYGGLENGLVNVVNSLQCAPYRHVIVALSEVTDFSKRLRPDVQVFAIGKKPGKDFRAYFRLFRLLKKIKPQVVHTRNFGTLECCIVAFLAGVPVRIHGEHGWDIYDPHGDRFKFKVVRRITSLFVRTFVAVSRELADWLIDNVGISSSKVQRICNGVDTALFKPGVNPGRDVLPPSLADTQAVLVGSVTRFSEIKDPMNLVEAFITYSESDRDDVHKARLVMIGDGDLRSEALRRLHTAGLADRAWLPGSRDDVPEILRLLDVFVQGSLREGVSNTVLEAMASGLPVIATDTGGNSELVVDSANGKIVPTQNRMAMAAALRQYIENEQLRSAHGEASRQRAESYFSLSGMIEQYRQLYANIFMQLRSQSCAA